MIPVINPAQIQEAIRRTQEALSDTEFLTSYIRQRVDVYADIYLQCGQGYFSGSAWMEV